MLQEDENCLQCYAIWERHSNVLEYKSGDCIDLTSTKDYICDISPDVSLQTLVQLEGKDVPCPLNTPLSFTYSRGADRDCVSPLSQVQGCLKNTQLLVRFQACPDLLQTESKEEVWTCKAVWRDDRDISQLFLIATLDNRFRRTDEERVRCLLVRNATSGYFVTQSSDATCNAGLQSSTEGFLSFNMKEVSAYTDCKYPAWLSKVKRFVSFDFQTLFEFSSDGKEMRRSNYSFTSKNEYLVSLTNCVQTIWQAESSFKLITRTVINCESMYRCTKFTKRTDSIVQMEEGLSTLVRMAACADTNFRSSNSISSFRHLYEGNQGQTTRTFTLIKENVQIQPCPNLGLHNLTGLYLVGSTKPCTQMAFNRITFSCPRREQIEFYRDCSEDATTSSYFCLGSWQEENRMDVRRDIPYSNQFYDKYRDSLDTFENVTFGYIIAKPEIRNSNSNRRVCLVYMALNNSYSWTVGKSECLRGVLPGVQGPHRFNTTVLGPCVSGGVVLSSCCCIMLYAGILVCSRYPAMPYAGILICSRYPAMLYLSVLLCIVLLV